MQNKIIEICLTTTNNNNNKKKNMKIKAGSKMAQVSF